MASKLVLRQEDYERVEKTLTDLGYLGNTEQDYSVTTQRIKAKWYRTVHVFERPPMGKELNQYEEEASKIKFRGTKAEVEGSRLTAAKNLYNKIILAVFDLPVGRQVLGPIEKGHPLKRDEARDKVPLLVKRAALLDMLSEVYSAAQIEEREGEDEVPEDQKQEED
jgi:hypothetical protein